MGPMLKRLLIVAVVIVLVAGVYVYREIRPQANVGAGYVAHQVCSCVFVAKRSYESCLLDLLPTMDAIQSEVVEVQGKNGIRGWVTVLANRTALHTSGLGCALD